MAATDQISEILTKDCHRRLRDVMATLMRHGASGVLENLSRGTLSSQISAKALRGALCELGPAFIKFGQILSTREELLSESFRSELAKLQDEVPPFPFSEAKSILEKELGGEIPGLFARFEETPAASGSIGQVHRGLLHDGTEVAVKIQRRNLEELIATDMAVIQQLISRVGGGQQPGDSITRLISDFVNNVHSELDYELEANNLDRFAWQFQHDPKIRIPHVIRSHSTRHILTTTYEPGTKLADLPGATVKSKIAAQSLAKTLLRQIFCFGFFHGDPHGDNVIATPEGAIGFYDLGLVGELCVSERECMNTLLLGLLQGNSEAATGALIELTGSLNSVDTSSLREDLRRFIEKHQPTDASAVQVTRLLADILQITKKHQLSLPRGFYLAFRALATVDSVGRKLDPTFDLISIGLPLLHRNHSTLPPQQTARLDLLGGETDPLLKIQDLSIALRAAFLQLSQGKLKLQFEHRGLEAVTRTYQSASLRLGLILFTAILTLGGYGIICCFILTRLATARQACLASLVLAAFSGALIFIICRGINNGSPNTRRTS